MGGVNTNMMIRGFQIKLKHVAILTEVVLESFPIFELRFLFP